MDATGQPTIEEEAEETMKTLFALSIHTMAGSE